MARRILDDPSLVERGRNHLEHFIAPDASQRAGYALWARLIAEPPATIAAQLIERSPHGDYVRETAPSFGALPGPVRARLLAAARGGLAATGA